MTDTLNDLAARIEGQIAETLRLPALDQARAVANEVGLRRARMAVHDSPDLVASAQDGYRVAQASERATRETYDAALLEAEWALDANFKSDGNRVYLRVRCEVCRGTGKEDSPVHDPVCSACTGSGTIRKFMTADERKAWKAAEAAKRPEVLAAHQNLRSAGEATAAARDAIEVARLRASSARHELDAAVAELQVLALALGGHAPTNGDGR